MKLQELEKKYGRKLISKVLNGDYLDGCTVGINKDGSYDYDIGKVYIVIIDTI